MTLGSTTDRIYDALKTLARPHKRCLIAIAGPPAVGKSSIATLLCEKLNQIQKQAAIVPMDGFHMDNATLTSKGLLHRKGAPMTFDFSSLKATLKNLETHDEVPVPLFDRTQDCTVPNAATITSADRFIIVEGNYLLLDQVEWRDLSQFWTYSVFVQTNLNELERRLIKRWLDHGLHATAAKKRARENDLINATTVLNHRMHSDLTLDN
jgi:pantothenate kinase